jgi:hypothetical protein
LRRVLDVSYSLPNMIPKSATVVLLIRSGMERAAAPLCTFRTVVNHQDLSEVVIRVVSSTEREAPGSSEMLSRSANPITVVSPRRTCGRHSSDGQLAHMRGSIMQTARPGQESCCTSSLRQQQMEMTNVWKSQQWPKTTIHSQGQRGSHTLFHLVFRPILRATCC